MSNINGIINILKPAGKSSFQVVSCVRRILSCRKAGHTGTLDPSAVGVLPVCLGKATKVIPYIPEEEKEYMAEIVLGKTTDTLDAEGKILTENDEWKKLGIPEIEESIMKFTGDIKQIPPMYSAIHHKGKRLYKLARQGKEVEREARDVEIKEIELLEINLPIIKLRILCSKGTYIRTLADDIGKELDCGAYLSKLTRSKSGPFFIKDAVTLDELDREKEKLLLSLDFPLDFPKIFIKERVFELAKNGSSLLPDDLISLDINLDELADKDKYILVYYNNFFISISKVLNTEEGLEIKPERVFNILI
ncbi:MAG: tRNA pseudouridine(55) synthase TruB [Halanaerobiales bacterium]